MTVPPPADSWQLAAAAAASQVALLDVLSSPSASSLSSVPATATPAPPAPPLPPLHVLRSSQADALRLDAELGSMLQEQLARLFEHFSPGRAAELEPELRAVLSLVVFGLSVWAGRATPGSELLNLRYRNERAMAAGPKDLVGPSGVDGPGLSRPQRLALGLGSAVLPYAWSRLCRTAHDGDWAVSDPGSWRRRAWGAVRWCEGAVAAAALVNSWTFLVRGDYRTLLERLVGARLVWRQAAMTRLVSFEYLNRQLVWQQLSEALLLLLPLVDLTRLRRAAMRALPRPVTAAAVGMQAGSRRGRGAAAAAAAAGSPTGRFISEGPAADTDNTALGASVHDPHEPARRSGRSGAGDSSDSNSTTGSGGGGADGGGACPLCGSDDMLTAVRALPCRHVFCYYCLRSSTQADPRFSCPVDGVRVAAMRRVGVVGAGAGA